MRITYLVHQYLPDHIGGTELYTHGIARRAHAAGHDVEVLTYRESATTDSVDFVTRDRSYEGVAVRELTHTLGASSDVARDEYENPFAGAWVADQLRRSPPDVLHVTHAMKFGVGGLDIARARHLPVVVSLTDFWFLCPRHTLLTWDNQLCRGPADFRACVRCVQHLHGIAGTRQDAKAIKARPRRLRTVLDRADRVIALSEFQRRMFVENGYDAEQFELVPHGIEPADLAGSFEPRSGTQTRFGLIGSIVEHKGAHIAVDAFRALPELDAELIVYGPLDEKDKYQGRVLAAAGNDPRIRFAGRFAPADTGRVLRSVDYVLAPALSFDNAPLVVKAALHVGVPVIASRLGSLIELVDDDACGWTVEAGDVDAWSEAFVRAIAERDSWSRTGRPQPDMDGHAARMLEIYSELAPGVPTRPARRP